MISPSTFSSVRLIVFDFDGVFTDNTVLVDQRGVESVRCWRSDGLGISRVLALGVQTYIISTEVNPVVTVRAEKLNTPCRQGVQRKDDEILNICGELGIPTKQTMFVGNDINDIPAFKVIGFPVAVADAYPEVSPYVIFQTERPGGLGAVREICDIVFEAKMLKIAKDNDIS
jgi:3-deoxy-D-manno-octulosonate 8-phosphate phosphatase (KDO 8-P phosphatase)